jgi:FMNH2-dependent dimethyl sulfone monooxygenase
MSAEQSSFKLKLKGVCLGKWMQFGIVLHVTAAYATWDNFLTLAKEAEALGYDSVWFSDHFISPSGRAHGLDTWTVLSALASATHRVRLGTYVLCNQFRHASLLARMAATFDNISNGRLDLGVGSGYFKQEHIAFGFGWNKHSERIERLKETIMVVRKLWAENWVSFDGKYFQLRDATLEPKPLQRPNPPIWIGGNSEAIRGVVAELGDGWIPVLPTREQLAAGVGDIRRKMGTLKRDVQELRVAYGGSSCALVAENEVAVKRLAEPLIRAMGKPLEELACLIGTPEQCIQKIEQYREAGAQQIVVGFYDFPSSRNMRIFAETVIPHFG